MNTTLSRWLMSRSGKTSSSLTAPAWQVRRPLFRAGQSGYARSVPRQIALGPDVTSPAEARLFVTHWTRAWGDRSLISAAALLTSELATNGGSHAASPFSVDVANTGHGIHVKLRDPSPAYVRLR